MAGDGKENYVANSSARTTAELLKQLKKLAHAGRPWDHDLLDSLVTQEPKRWMALLLLDGVIPDPHSPEWLHGLKSMLEGVAEGLSASLPSDVALSIMSVASSLMALGRCFDSLRRQLEETPVWSAPAAFIYRLGAFLESQAFIAAQRHTAVASQGEGYDPVAALRSTLQGPVEGAAKLTLLQSIEEQCEMVELVVRYLQHKHIPNVGFGDLSQLPSPYEDASLHTALNIANTWRMLNELWAHIKFLGWLPDTKDEATRYWPPDVEEFMLAETGKVRENVFRHQILMTEWVLKERLDSDNDAQMKALSESVSLPAPGEVWDGKIDVEGMRQGARSTTWRRTAEYYIGLRNYVPLLAEVRFGKQAGWPEWIRGMDVLKLLAGALQRKAWSTVPDIVGHGCLGSVFVLRRNDLRDLLVLTAEFTLDDADDLLQSFVFDARRKTREIWDQPLLPLEDELLLLVPSVVLSTSPMRAIENLIADVGNSFSVGGKPFEAYVEQVLVVDAGAQVERGLKFDASDGRPVEFDLVAWWQGRLLLVETKCLKSIHSAADQYRARREVEEAVQQLSRRRKLSVSDWPTLRKTATKLDLPEKAPDASAIICVALTNALQFTGAERDGVLVTDDLCFRRFFGEPEVVQLGIGPDGVTSRRTGRVIRQGRASPMSLLQYLRDPPQVSVIRKKIKPAWLPIAAPEQGLNPILLLASEFSGTAKDLWAPLGREQDWRPLSKEEIARRHIATKRDKQKQVRKKKRTDARKGRH